MTTVYTDSLAFALGEVARTRTRAKRAVAHRDVVGALEVSELRRLADHACHVALAAYRSALGKRAFELRALAS